MAKLADETIAKILAESNFFGDKATAQRWGVSDRSIRRWRTDWEDVEEKQNLYLTECNRLNMEWAQDATRCMKIAFSKAEELIKNDWKPGQLAELGGFIQTVGELKVADTALRGE